jgi:iron complex outermembrane receptor protein
VLVATYSNLLQTTDVSNPKFSLFQSETKQLELIFTQPGAPGLNGDAIIRVFGDEQLGSMYGYQVDKISDDGALLYKDLNGDKVINDKDKTIIGNGLPTASVSFINNFKFGNFDFSFQLRGDFGHDIFNSYRIFYERSTNTTRPIDNVVKTKYLDEKLTKSETITTSDRYVEKGDYVALDQLTLGYTFPLPKTGAFKNIRVYLNGQNLAFITGYTGVDPTPRYGDSENNNNLLAPGIDRRNLYFRTRTFSVGVNFGL